MKYPFSHKSLLRISFNSNKRFNYLYLLKDPYEPIFLYIHSHLYFFILIFSLTSSLFAFTFKTILNIYKLTGVCENIAHGGITRGARRICAKLEELHLIELAQKLRPDYPIVVTGHSLGAGIATILSILLRSKYPNLTCLAFSPPLSLLLQNYLKGKLCFNSYVFSLGIVTVNIFLDFWTFFASVDILRCYNTYFSA
ncbi:unnamed protein product [Protopolystoma xenopodis]|uniref:sn-1-specific diacylglycerol lipase n=1 Tax=Protopolystoma xenopodis TaxID=117903 RepID=A0A3S5A4G5_9PLAT|nr:unnamed protein product [Protopolystoma xenopodis]